MVAPDVVLDCCLVQPSLSTSPRLCSSHSASEWQEQPWLLPAAPGEARWGEGAAAMEGHSSQMRLRCSVTNTNMQRCSHRACMCCWRCSWWPGTTCASFPKLIGSHHTSSRVSPSLCSQQRQKARGSSLFSCTWHHLWAALPVPLPGQSSAWRSSGPEWRLMYLSMLCCYCSWGCSAPLSNPAYPVSYLSPGESACPSTLKKNLCCSHISSQFYTNQE